MHLVPLDGDGEGHGGARVADGGQSEGGSGAGAVGFGGWIGGGADCAGIRHARKLVAVVAAVLVALQIASPVRLQQSHFVVHGLVVVVTHRIVDVPHQKAVSW